MIRGCGRREGVPGEDRRLRCRWLPGEARPGRTGSPRHQHGARRAGRRPPARCGEVGGDGRRRAAGRRHGRPGRSRRGLPGLRRRHQLRRTLHVVRPRGDPGGHLGRCPLRRHGRRAALPQVGLRHPGRCGGARRGHRHPGRQRRLPARRPDRPSARRAPRTDRGDQCQPLHHRRWWAVPRLTALGRRDDRRDQRGRARLPRRRLADRRRGPARVRRRSRRRAADRGGQVPLAGGDHHSAARAGPARGEPGRRRGRCPAEYAIHFADHRQPAGGPVRGRPSSPTVHVPRRRGRP